MIGKLTSLTIALFVSFSTTYADLTFEEAKDRMVRCAYPIREARRDVAIHEAEKVQAGAYPNPSLLLEWDNIYGTGEYKSVRNREQTYAISQPIEMGGKRAHRIRTASALRDAACWSKEDVLLAMTHRLRVLFIEMSAAQQLLELRQEEHQLHDNIVKATTELFEAGKVPKLKAREAEAVLLEKTGSLRQAEATVRQLRAEIALMFNLPEPDFERVNYSLEPTDPPPASLEEILNHLTCTPRYRKNQSEIRAACHSVKLAQAHSVPDIEITGGYHYYQDPGDSCYLVQLSFPLPVFDQNRGNICKAKLELQQAKEKLSEINLQWMKEVTKAYNYLQDAYEISKAYCSDIADAQKQLYEASKEGYQEGQYDIWEVWNKKRSHLETEMKKIAVCQDYHLAKAQLDLLTGNCFEHFGEH